MIQKLPFILKLTIFEHRQLIMRKPWLKKWDCDDPIIIGIKSKIKEQLVDNQDCCAYCGLPFKGNKDKQIEHIAPKASYRQPQFTFTLQNLVLSCVYCNTLIVKGTKPTIELPVNNLYQKCKFLIVHPYFDDPDLHYEWVDEDKIVIQVKNNSSQGRKSIEMFDLDSQGMTEMREALSYICKMKATKPVSAEDENSINKTLDFKE